MFEGRFEGEYHLQDEEDPSTVEEIMKWYLLGDYQSLDKLKELMHLWDHFQTLKIQKDTKTKWSISSQLQEIHEFYYDQRGLILENIEPKLVQIRPYHQTVDTNRGNFTSPDRRDQIEVLKDMKLRLDKYYKKMDNPIHRLSAYYSQYLIEHLKILTC